jgi:hypothetical protein
MIERAQFDIGIESQRVTTMGAQGFTIDEQKAYVEQQLITDIGERVDRAESHYIYELRNGQMYAQGFSEPFTQVMERGIIQTWDGSRERAEVAGIKLIQTLPEAGMAFWPSRPDGKNYKKNYLDVAKRVGKEIHMVRYFSDLSAEECREKIIAINPAYEEILPDHPTDVDFFLNPVFVPRHLDMNPDQLAEFILDGKKGMDEKEFQRIVSENAWLITATINTLVENPQAISEHETHQKALYAGVRNSKDGVYRSNFTLPKMEIVYQLSEQKETLGGGGCGAGGCSTGSESVSSFFSFSPDGKGPLKFACPSCGAINERPIGGYVYKCKNTKCENPEAVLPPELRNFQSGQKLLQ